MSADLFGAGGIASTVTSQLFGQVGISTGTGSIAKTGKCEGKDIKLERILSKFKAGKKLSGDELSYVAKKSPETWQKILRVMQRREQVEKRLENAKTKEESQEIMTQEMKSVENVEDPFEKEATVNHLREAYSEHVTKGNYKEKPDTNLELAKRQVQEMAEKFQPVAEDENSEKDNISKAFETAGESDNMETSQFSTSSSDAGDTPCIPDTEQQTGKEGTSHTGSTQNGELHSTATSGKKKASRGKNSGNINIRV